MINNIFLIQSFNMLHEGRIKCLTTSSPLISTLPPFSNAVSIFMECRNFIQELPDKNTSVHISLEAGSLLCQQHMLKASLERLKYAPCPSTFSD